MTLATYIVVTYWWQNGNIANPNTHFNHFSQKKQKKLTYKKLIDRMKENLKTKKIEFFHKRIPFANYQNNINNKPSFIKDCIVKFKKPVLYIDADMLIHKRPVLIESAIDDTDFMAYNWSVQKSRKFETSGGLFFFNNTKNSLKLLTLWESELKKKSNVGKADDRVLAMVFAKHRAYEWCRCKWFPMSYFYIPQFFYKSIQHDKVYISHPYDATDERDAFKWGSHPNRIPNSYETVVNR